MIRVTAAQIEALGRISGLVASDPGDPRDHASRTTLDLEVSTVAAVPILSATEVRHPNDQATAHTYLIDANGGTVRL